MPFDETPRDGGGGGGPCPACRGRGYVHSLVVTDVDHAVYAMPCPAACAAGHSFERKAREFAEEARAEMGAKPGSEFRSIASIIQALYARNYPRPDQEGDGDGN